MTVRPVIEEDTVERVNEKLGDVMAVDPEDVGLGKKINILVDELEKQRHKRSLAEKRAENDQGGLR